MADIPVLLKRSGVKGKLPNPDNAQYGELFVNYHSSDPMLCFKNNAGEIVQLKPARSIDGGGGELPPDTGNENGDTIWNGTQLLVWDTDQWIPVGPNDLAYENAADKGTITNTAGSDVELPVATDAAAGLQSAADKGKLDGVEAGANANVNADWDAVDGDAEILNKPDIPDAQVQSDWAQADTGAVDFIKNKPAIPDEQVQADWDQATTTEPDFIKNKPTDLSDFNNGPGFITDAGVTSIIAGDNVTIDQSTGDVTIAATGGGGGGASVDVGETPPDPSGATEGDLFWSETSGRLYVFAQGAWIDASPDGGSGGGGTAGVTSIIAGDGISIDQSTGDVTITNTGGGGGGDDPGTPGVRYQQGTWKAIGSAAGSGEFTADTNNCLWTRVGNQVTLDLDLRNFSQQTSGEIGFVNLPYPSADISGCIYQGIVGDSTYITMDTEEPDTYIQPYLRVSDSSSKIDLMSRYDAYKHTQVGSNNVGYLDGSSTLRGSITYTTDDTTFVPGGTDVTKEVDIQGTGGGSDGGGGADAWGRITTDGTLKKGYNCTVENIGTGLYQVTFVTPMPNESYSISLGTASSAGGSSYKSATTTGFQIKTVNSSGSNSNLGTSFAVFATEGGGSGGGGGADAWGSINKDASISASYNIASVVSAGNGFYDITFVTPMPSSSYSITTATAQTAIVAYIWGNMKTASGFRIETRATADNAEENAPFDFAVHASSTVTPTYTWTRDGTELKPANPGDQIILKDGDFGKFQITTRGGAGVEQMTVYNGSGDSTAAIASDGSATFAGKVTAPNVTFNLDLDDPSKVLDVKESILKLTTAMAAINKAAESASNLSSLKTAIKTATADFLEAN